jgi:hypothetical protein
MAMSVNISSPRMQPALSPLAGEGWGEGWSRALILWLPPSLSLPRKGGGNDGTRSVAMAGIRRGATP